MKREFNFRNQEKVGQTISVYNQLFSTFKPIFDEMNYNYNMIVSKNQWKAEDKAALEAAGRPANAYNLLSGVVKHLSSQEGGSRKKVTAAPRSYGDLNDALTMTKLIDYCLTNQKYDYHRTRAFIDAIIARWGWIRTMWSFEDDPLGMLSLEAVNPMTLMFDMSYSDITLKRSQYVMYAPDMTLDQIVNQYAYDNTELLNAILEEGRKFFVQDVKEQKKFISTALVTLINTASQFISGQTSDEYNRTLRTESWFDALTGKFKVLELHERRTERRMVIYDPDANKQVDITDEIVSQDGYTEDKELMQLAMQKYPNAPEPRWSLHKQIWITTCIPAMNLIVAEEPYAIQNKNFMFSPVFAYDFHADMKQSQSVIDELLDPQTDYNKRRSTMLEMLVRFSATGYLVEEGAIDGYEADYESKKIGQYKRVKRGHLNSIKPEETPRIPPELFRDNEESKMLIEYISSTTKAVRGIQEGSNEPAKLFAAKNNVSLQMIQHLFDNLDFLNLSVGENTKANIQKFMTMQRAFRITNDYDKPEFVEVNKPELAIQDGQVITRILNDVTVGEYDIVISNAPYGATAREIEFIKLVDLMKLAIEVNPMAAQKMFPILIKASDSPYRADFMEALGAMEGQDKESQIQTAMAQLQMAFQELGLDKLRAEVQNQLIQNQQDQVETQGKQLDNAKKQQELNMQAKAAKLQDLLTGIGNNYARA